MSISNLSFIIIAHNEEFALDKCLASIMRMKLDNCEVICIDSNSTDNTNAIAQSYRYRIEDLSVIRLAGYQNAAIARNAGIKQAEKEYIFFTDGDVELNEEFVQTAFKRLVDNEADAIYGRLDDYEYDETYSKVIRVRENRASIRREEIRYLCGGIFMVRKSVVDDIGYFDERLVKCEDFDYTLRLTRKYTLKVIPVSMGRHHTVPYSSKSRLSNELKNKLPVYYGALIRKNMKNIRGSLSHIYKAGYLRGILIDTLFVAAIFYPLLIAPALVLVGLDIAVGMAKSQDIRYRLISHYLIPLYVIYGFIAGPKYIDINRPPPG